MRPSALVDFNEHCLRMRASQQPASVLHVSAWRETSLLVECLTRDFGRLGLVARGARGARARVARAAFEPFQPLRVDLRGDGDLLNVGAVEPVGTPRALGGVALLSGLYLNELVVRLVPRADPCPGLLECYERTLDVLAAGRDIAWNLRRFERDLLQLAGYALQLEATGDDGTELDPNADYVYVSGQGPEPWHGQAGERLRGAWLLDLAADRMADAAAASPLRRLLRSEITAQLGGRELASWRVLGAALRADRR